MALIRFASTNRLCHVRVGSRRSRKPCRLNVANRVVGRVGELGARQAADQLRPHSIVSGGRGRGEPSYSHSMVAGGLLLMS